MLVEHIICIEKYKNEQKLSPHIKESIKCAIMSKLCHDQGMPCSTYYGPLPDVRKALVFTGIMFEAS